MRKIFGIWTEIYIKSAPNNSNETYTFMCLGRAGRFGQGKNWFEIEMWNLNRLAHIEYNVWGRISDWKVKIITHDLNQDLTFYCPHNQLYKVNV